MCVEVHFPAQRRAIFPALLCTVQIWNHPDILYQFVAQRKEDNDLDLEDVPHRPAMNGRGGNCNSPTPMTMMMSRRGHRSRLQRSNTTSSLDDMMSAVDVNRKDSVITYDWVGCEWSCMYIMSCGLDNCLLSHS